MMNFSKKLAIWIAMLMLFLGTGFSREAVSPQAYPTPRPIRYTPISYEALRRVPGLERWYQRNYQRRGIHYRNHRGITYVIISAGQRPTGGYRVIINDIRRLPRRRVFIRASVLRPAPDMVVTQAITYPHLLVRIEEPNVARVQGIVNEFVREENDAERPDKSIQE